MDSFFRNKNAVVTGGASGIGKAVAKQLLHLGSNVVIVDRNDDALHQVLSEFNTSQVIGVAANVTHKPDVERYVATATEKFGGIDLFHNNAGIIGPTGPIIDFKVEDFQQVFEINVLGVLLGMQSVARHMISRGEGGSIVNTGSAVGTRSVTDHGIYGASKAAVLRLTQQAAGELGAFGIRVNAIAPGSVDTPLLRNSFRAGGRSGPEADRLLDQQLANRPLARATQPEDVANLVLWLLGPQSRMITGAVNIIDGGVMI
jgi:NAD(P)-dependent dehydrogenase (short-subunit alcohol dehydrogenase family)